MSREVLYPDGSGPRCKVEYDSTYRLGKGDEAKQRWVKIYAVGLSGDYGLIRVADIPFMVEALQEAQRLDEFVED